LTLADLQEKTSSCLAIHGEVMEEEIFDKFVFSIIIKTITNNLYEKNLKRGHEVIFILTC
jgi:hypothetical protein